MPIDDIKRYTKDILNGLMHMHRERIVHRDLKPENILLLKNGHVKICDFGSSKFIDERNFMNTPYVVSRYYRAPELIFAANNYNEAIDIWAVGCILFELITKTPLFPGDTEGLQILEQACVIGSPTERDLAKLSEIVEDRVLKIVKKASSLQPIDLRKLFSANGAYQAEDVEAAANLIQRMLRWVPSDRISAEDAMMHPFLAST
jgi:serine/threonine protein kinase